MSVAVDFTAPQKPGQYFACFRLLQGDSNAFGDKVFLNLTAKDKAAEPKTEDVIIGVDRKAEEAIAKQEKTAAEKEKDDLLWRSQKLDDDVDKFAEGEELDSSIVIEGSGNDGSVEPVDKEASVPVPSGEDKDLGSALIEEVEPQPLHKADKPEQSNVLIQEKPSALAESLKIQESTGPSALAVPTQGANGPEYCGDDSMLAAMLQSEFNSADQNNKPKVEAKPEVVSPDPELKQSEQSAVDLQKVAYLEKLNTAPYNKDFKDNLQNLMSMGFLDFTKNLALLAQHHNNLEPVLGKLIDN